MSNLLIQNISIEQLNLDASKVDISKGATYYKSYPAFVEYFNQLSTLCENNLIIGANFTYGWMPTILKYKSNKIKEVLDVLNKVKANKIIDLLDILTIKSFLNNSMVGTSKLLHFISPSQYPILDSRVFRYLTNNNPHHYRLNSGELYLEYKKLCDKLTQSPEYASIHKKIVKQVGYQMTPLRTIELIMYSNGGKDAINQTFDFTSKRK